MKQTKAFILMFGLIVQVVNLTASRDVDKNCCEQVAGWIKSCAVACKPFLGFMMQDQYGHKKNDRLIGEDPEADNALQHGRSFESLDAYRNVSFDFSPEPDEIIIFEHIDPYDMQMQKALAASLSDFSSVKTHKKDNSSSNNMYKSQCNVTDSSSSSLEGYAVPLFFETNYENELVKNRRSPLREQLFSISDELQSPASQEVLAVPSKKIIQDAQVFDKKAFLVETRAWRKMLRLPQKPKKETIENILDSNVSETGRSNFDRPSKRTFVTARALSPVHYSNFTENSENNSSI